MKFQTLLFALALCLPFFAQAQDAPIEEIELDTESLTPYTKNSQFGIMLELNSSQADINTSEFTNLEFPSRVNGVSTQNGLGIGIGILYGYEFNDFMTLRTQAMLSFLETSFTFDLAEELDKTLVRETVNLEFPLHLVLENVNKNISPSAVIGARYRHNLARNTLSSKIVGNYSTNDVLLDAGVGLGFKIDNFRFKTELLYSRGLINQVAENTPRSLNNAISQNNTNQLSLRFMFYM